MPLFPFISLSRGSSFMFGPTNISRFFLSHLLFKLSDVFQLLPVGALETLLVPVIKVLLNKEVATTAGAFL